MPSADQTTLLHDTNEDRITDVLLEFLTRLHSPFGMPLIGSDLPVANTDALLRIPYPAGQQHIDAIGATGTPTCRPGRDPEDRPSQRQSPGERHWTVQCERTRPGAGAVAREVGDVAALRALANRPLRQSA
jgi:hypothetical protein